MEKKIIKGIDKYVAEIDALFEKDNPLSDLDRWCPKNGSIRAHIDSIAFSIGQMKIQLTEKEKKIAELNELKEKARDIGCAIFEWQGRLTKSVSILNQSKKASKSKMLAEVRKMIKEVVERMSARINTWSI